MRVLVVSSDYPTADRPQQGRFVHRQIRNLVRLGLDCRVLTYRPAPPPFPRWLVRRSWLRYHWERLGNPGHVDGVRVDETFYQRDWTPGEDVVPAIGTALVDFMAARHAGWTPDVIYANWLWSAGAAALALRRRFGWPLAAIARGSEMHEWHRVQPHCRPYVAEVLDQADQPLANCQALRSLADDCVPGASDRIEVVYNGCDSSEFRPAADREALRGSLGISPSTRVLLYCGDVIARKGLDELVEAWRRFAARHGHWRLVVAGRPVDRALVDRLTSADRVQLTGPLSRERVLAYMQAADAYVQPSRLEGLANATMEAMAVGLPVVSSDACGQRELIVDGSNGWLVPAGDPSALADALGEIAADEEGAWTRGGEARRTIQDRFDPLQHAGRLAGILTRVAAAAPSLHHR